MSDNIVQFLNAMGEPEMADEVAAMSNRLEAFSDGIDRDCFDAQVSANKALMAEVEALREDAERFEWMLKHSDATVCSEGPYGKFHVWFRYSNRTTDEYNTAREAIDAARKSIPTNSLEV